MMLKALALSAVVALSLHTGEILAQPAILKAPSVAKARACLDKLAIDAKKAGLYVDRDAGQILVLNPKQPELLPLLVSMAECLDDAYPSNEVVKHPRTGTPSRIWYDSVDDYYAWCASNSLENILEQIDVLGGRSPRRDWYAITFSCSVGEKILGFYEP
jgi:hypothetical protein